MRKSRAIQATMATGALVLCAGLAHADEFSARLSGFDEVGALAAVGQPNAETGAILSDGTGTLRLDLNRKAKTIKYKLTYSGLTGVLQAHIHFAKVHVPGNILAFLCTNLGNNPAGTPTPPACPDSGTVTGTLLPASVIAQPSQNVTVAGDFDALADAITSDTAYVNIHTASFKSGEIRGQVRSDDKQGDSSRPK